MAKVNICFLVGSVALSGGTYVIFQHACYLREQGYKVTLAVQEPFDAKTLAWHDKGHQLRCLSIDEARQESFDLVIATWWKTALELGSFDAPHHAYFVQSIESRFYPEAEVPLRALIDATYNLPVSYVTEATWIVKHLKEEFGKNASLVRNGIRKDIYTTEGIAVEPRSSGVPRILVEGHFGVPFKNTALAIRLARKAGARDIWVMTGSPIRRVPCVSRVFSRVPIHRTPEIYRSCDIILKLSTVEGMFGPPLEMFHCGGTALTFDVTGHDEYIRDGENAVVVPGRDPSRVVREIQSFLQDCQKLDRLKSGAIATAENWPDWHSSSVQFEQWMSSVLQADETERVVIQEKVQAAWMRYREEEGRRLKENPMIVVRHKAHQLVRRLPTKLQDTIRQIRTLAEVLCPSWRVF